MPLAKKEFLIPIFLMIITSSFSGCVLEDVFLGGTNFTLNTYNIIDDEGFPAISINFTCSDTINVKVLKNNKLVDSDLFFKGNHNPVLHLVGYRDTITPGSYKIKAFDNDNK